MAKNSVKPKKRRKQCAAQEPKRQRGRPCSYKEEYADFARRYCLLNEGATDEDLAALFDKNIDTIYEWKKKFPEFSEAIRAGKVVADVEVADSLYNRAIGATWIEEVAFKVKTINYENGKKVSEVETVKVVGLRKAAPPDTNAIALWLYNRRGGQWRMKPEAKPPTELPVGEEYTLNPDEPVPDAPVL